MASPSLSKCAYPFSALDSERDANAMGCSVPFWKEQLPRHKARHHKTTIVPYWDHNESTVSQMSAVPWLSERQLVVGFPMTIG